MEGYITISILVEVVSLVLIPVVSIDIIPVVTNVSGHVKGVTKEVVMYDSIIRTG